MITLGASRRTFADPSPEHDSMVPLWKRSRAVCAGETTVKNADAIVNTANMLIPFSPGMEQDKYDFYKAEAELPGVSSEYLAMLIGGLLRKEPSVTIEKASEEVMTWVKEQFGADNSSFVSFLYDALAEEFVAKAWVQISFPSVDPEGYKNMKVEDREKFKPYPILLKAESVINWNFTTDSFGVKRLSRLVTRLFVDEFKDEEVHPEVYEEVTIHEIVEGRYRTRTFRSAVNSQVAVSTGVRQQTNQQKTWSAPIINDQILNKGAPLDFIPIIPLNGSFELEKPLMYTFVQKEIALYNKISRRNHLLYGASTFTPVISADMNDEKFEEIVDAGLGSWIKLPMGGSVTVLDTPTGALSDMDRSITSGFEELARLGMRMLSPEVSQSGVALELRNAAQTARLATQSNKISRALEWIIAVMVTWRTGKPVSPEEVQVILSEDFNPTPLGADWLRLATEWYQQGLIPRSVWVALVKQNDMVPGDYNDKKGQEEILTDSLLSVNRSAEVAAANILKNKEIAEVTGVDPATGLPPQPQDEENDEETRGAARK